MIKFILISVFCFLFNTLLLVAPSSAETAEEYYYQANLRLTSGKMNEAVTFYQMATEKKTDFYEAYLGLSIAYRELEQYEKANEAIRKVLSINPEYTQVYYNLGLILEKQNKNEEAIRAYEKFLDTVPGAARFTDVKQRIQRLKK